MCPVRDLRLLSEVGATEVSEAHKAKQIRDENTRLRRGAFGRSWA